MITFPLAHEFSLEIRTFHLLLIKMKSVMFFEKVEIPYYLRKHSKPVRSLV